MSQKSYPSNALISRDAERGTCLVNIHSIESFGTLDGPGIRFVIFLQGCPFRCLYCSNPDTMQFMQGEDRTIDSLFDQAMRFKPYFSNNGGVTVSGGEACCQAKKLVPLFTKLQEHGVHTALDTNGYVMNRHVEELIEKTDLVLLDVKHIDTSIHEVITGKSNDKVLNFANHLKKIGKSTWLRYVLVPGITDNPKHLHALGEHFKSFENIEKLEIQPYHKHGVHKWKALEKKYLLKEVPENTPEQINQAKEIFDRYFQEVVVN